MTKWFVMVGVFDTIEVEAVSQEDAELRALDLFDPNMEEPYVHSAWSEDCEPSTGTYNVPVEPDYNWVIDQFEGEERKKYMKAFMEENVYPHFR
jgi:hypothetical protein